MIGDAFFEIPHSVIKQLIEWNTNAPENSNIDIDRRFVQALLLILLSKDQIMANNIPKHVLEFIRGKEISNFYVVSIFEENLFLQNYLHIE